MRAKLFVLAITVPAIVSLAACSGGKAGPAPGAAPAAGDIETGKAVYASAGCVACHGAQGWGTQNGPPLVGVPIDEVTETVRNPKPPMPRFGADAMSDAKLAALASYASSFKPPALNAAMKEHLEEAMEHAEAKDKDGAMLHLKKAQGTGQAEFDGTLRFLQHLAEEGEFEELEEFTGMLMGKSHPK